MKVAALLTLALAALLLPARAVPIPGVDDFRTDALKAVNAFRVAEGRKPVVLDDGVNALSLEWARRLAEKGRMEHRTRNDMYTLVGIHGWKAFNENLYMGHGASTVAEVIEAWKNSPGHRRNLLQENIDRLGFGIATSDGGSFYAVFNGAGK